MGTRQALNSMAGVLRRREEDREGDRNTNSSHVLSV